MASPRVSVVMPVHNGGEWLQQAVESVLGQSLADIELIVVDDHSDDGAVDSLVISDPRMKRLASPARGVSAAFNAGLAVASGRYVARMDADDVALPRRLERQLAYLESRPALALCGACVEIFSATGVQGGNRRYETWLNGCREPDAIRRQLFVESPIPNPTAFFRREAIEALGGYGDPPWPEDYDLFLRADAMGMAMGKPEGVLLRWRDHGARLTRCDDRYALERFQAAKIHYLSHYRLPFGVAPVIWGAGPTGQSIHDLLLAEGRPVSGFIEVHPRRIGGEKRGLPVWPIEWLASNPDAFVLAAVGAAGARAKIRRFLDDLDRVEGEHYLFVA